MKKVRFKSPKKVLKSTTMNDSECHSPRPFIEKQIETKPPNLYYEYCKKGLHVSNDSVQMFECSNSSPYPTADKTDVRGPYGRGAKWVPSSELDLSILDASNHEPRQPVFSKPVFISQGENRKNDLIQNKSIPVSNRQQNVLSSIENTEVISPNVLCKDNDFFIKRDNLDKICLKDINPLQNQFNRLSLGKENNPKAKKLEILGMGIPNPVLPVISENYLPSNFSATNDGCRCHHCVKVIHRNFTHMSPPFVDVPNQSSFNECSTQSVNKHCNCGTPPLPKSCPYCIYNMQIARQDCHTTCHCGSTNPPFVQSGKQTAIDKKTWAIERYEQSRKVECSEVEKQTTVVKEKREPTVADLFKIIKLQNEQLQLLQEKVDKFISASQTQNLNHLPVQNYISEHVALETVNKDERKISIGVMTSFEMVRTSRVINQDIVKKSHENAQIQCNRSQISIVTSQPVNQNFLEGIKPIPKTVQDVHTSVDESIHENEAKTTDDAVIHQTVSINEDKTLNELSLFNVQVDNATSPLMSPEHSLYLDVRDYSDSESSSDDQSRVGWTYYNKVMTHVNGMLQDSDIPSSASALYRNTRQQCLQMQIDKTNVSVTKRVKFGDDPLGIHQPHIYTASTDTSLKMNQLAAKYLKKGPTPQTPLLNQQPMPKPSAVPVDMSFATRNYMEKHKLLPGTSPSFKPPSVELPRFLDITALKQQPKLL